MKNLPKFIDDLPDDEVQPIVVQAQGDEYVAIIQWDGAGEFQHWVLVKREDVKKLIEQLNAA